MIQRIQTVYLALVELIFISLFFVPVFDRHFNNTNIVTHQTLSDLPLLMAGTFILSAIAVATIFQFKKRPLQIKLCNLGMILSLIVFAAVTAFPKLFSGEVTVTNIHFQTSFGIGTWFIAAPAFLFFLASRAIKKDEELVRSADRLR